MALQKGAPYYVAVELRFSSEVVDNQSRMIKQNSLRVLRDDYYFMPEIEAHVEFMQSPQLWYNKPLTDPIFELQVGHKLAVRK